MVAAKSRLQKVPNVRQKLHNYKGTPSQRLNELKISAVSGVKKAVRKGVSAAKSVAQKVANKVQMPPPVAIPKAAVKSAPSAVQNAATFMGAVNNVKELQAKVKHPPPITQPSPASQAYKAGSSMTTRVGSSAPTPKRDTKPALSGVMGGSRKPAGPLPEMRTPVLGGIPDVAAPSRPMPTPKTAPLVPPKPAALKGSRLK